MSLRMTIGERLGRVPRATTPPARTSTREDAESSDGVPTAVAPEKVLRLADLPSARTIPVEIVPEPKDGPPRVRGEMVWLHKTAPVLVIEGRPGLSPEEHNAGRRR